MYRLTPTEAELLWTVGEKRRIEYELSGEAGDRVLATAVTLTVIDAAGEAVLTEATGVIGRATEAERVRLWGVWDTTGAEAGDYRTQLTVTVGEGDEAETLVARGSVTLLGALGSLLERWQRRIADWILSCPAAEAHTLLNERQYQLAAQAAVREYSKQQPQSLSVDVALVANQFEYDLPTGWVAGFSHLTDLEYPVDDTQQTRTWLTPADTEVDEVRGKWRFVALLPSAGETARLYHTAPHTLSAAADTTPAEAFDSVAQYAAGLALLSLANRSAGTSGPAIGADMVSHRTKQQEYASQARAMLAEARRSWGSPAAAATAQMEYLGDHGRLVFWD